MSGRSHCKFDVLCSKRPAFLPEKPGVVVHQGALGDFLLALPVIEGIARAYSGLRFSFWSPRRHLSLLYGKDYIESALGSADIRWTPLYREDHWQGCALPHGLAEAGLILVFGQDSNRVLVDRLKQRVEGTVHWLKSFPPAGDTIHTTDFLEEQVSRCSLRLSRVSFRLVPDPRETAAIGERLSGRGIGSRHRLVVVHPGSGGFRKIWPLSRWRSLLHWLSGWVDVRIVVVLGSADERIRPFIDEATSACGAIFLDDLQLNALGALLSGAALYIGNDSGVTHLAASYGTPTIALFGPSDSAVWGPRGPSVEIIQDSWAEEEILAPQWSLSPSDSESRIRDIITARFT
jgi:heptosyltransferase III